MPQDATIQDDAIFLRTFAPALLAFTEWVLQEAQKGKIRRLYFLARDGSMPYRMAQTLCRARGIDIDCRYAKVSRFAIRRAEYHLLGEKSLDLLCVSGIDITFDKVMKRACLTENEANLIAERTGHVTDRKEVLHVRQLQALKEELRSDPLFLNLVYQHAKEAYPQAVAYLRQEGFLDDVPYALVDSGWIGTLQQSLEHLLQTAGKPDALRGYYFGLYEIPVGSVPQNYRAFFFEPKGHLQRKVHFSNCLFETVCSAPEGMTIGYREEGGKYVAIESDHANPNREHILRETELAVRFAEVRATRTKERTDARYATVLTDANTEEGLQKLMSHPTAEEVEFFGNRLFCDDLLELQMQKVAAELTEEEIQRQRLLPKALILLGLRHDVIHESAWIEGSIVRAGNGNKRRIRKNLRHAAWYKWMVYLKKAR